MRHNNLNFFNYKLFSTLIIIFYIILFSTSLSYGKDIGTFLHLIGKVFYLKENKPPEVPAKVQEGVGVGDGVCTRKSSRAHIRLIDISDLFISPQSKIVIESYFIDNIKAKDTIVSIFTKGLVHMIFNLLGKENNPELYFKTTYVIGSVRGTDFYVLIGNNFTDIFVKTGRVLLGAIQVNRPYSRELNKLERQLEIRAGGGAGASPAVLNGAEAIGHSFYIGPQQAVRFGEGIRPSRVRLPLEYFDRLDKLMITGLPDHFQAGKDPKHLLELIGPLQ